VSFKRLPTRTRATGSRHATRPPAVGDGAAAPRTPKAPERKLRFRFRRSEADLTSPASGGQTPVSDAPAGGSGPLTVAPGLHPPPPAPVDERLEGLLDPDETARMVVATDIDHDGNYGEQLLVATNKRLLVVQTGVDGEGETTDDGTGRRGSNGTREEMQLAHAPPLTLSDIALAVPLEKIVEVQARDLVGAGALEIKIKDDGGTLPAAAPTDGDGDADTGERCAKVDAVRFTRSLVDRFNEAADQIEDLARERGAELTEGEGHGKRKRNAKPRCEQCDRVLPPGSEICPACLKRGKIVLRMLGYVRPYLGLAILSFVATLLVTVIGLAPPMMMRSLTDGALAPRMPRPIAAREHLLWIIVAMLFFQRVGSSTFGAVRYWLNGYLGQRIIFDVRSRVYQHLQSLSMGFYDRKSVGTLMSNVTNDTSVLHSFCVDGLQNMLVNTMTLVGIGATLFWMNWQLALIVLIPTPILVFGSKWFSKKLRVVYRRYYREWAMISGILASTFSGVRVVKGFVQEERETDRFIDKIRTFMGVSLTTTKMYTFYGPTINLLLSVGSVLIWAMGGYQLIHDTGNITLGTLTAFTAYMWQFYAPISALCELNNTVQNACTAAERVFQTLDTEPEIRDVADAVDLPHIEGRLEFQNVRFYYDRDSGDPVLADINLEVAPGELIGLVGHSGSGKTTLVNLLMRFYDPTDGVITLDGVDLRQLKVQVLRRQIGFVSQEPFMFSGTITENIAYGRPDATFPEIMEAASAANAHEFIMRFPDAYNTEVGERGVKLSGGEKQRISIARAILNNPRILVLDEATSAVDTETEALIQEAMDRLMQGRTAFAIAHRLSTLKSANRLVVMDKGKIAEIGTHEELLAKDDGVYARLVRIQSEMHRSVAV
jgi:ATP-binding cassette, subfamily B, bacterial